MEEKQHTLHELFKTDQHALHTVDNNEDKTVCTSCKVEYSLTKQHSVHEICKTNQHALHTVHTTLMTK
jgi:hypothetical protein